MKEARLLKDLKKTKAYSPKCDDSQNAQKERSEEKM